jgi:hypothetical protein
VVGGRWVDRRRNSCPFVLRTVENFRLLLMSESVSNEKLSGFACPSPDVHPSILDHHPSIIRSAHYERTTDDHEAEGRQTVLIRSDRHRSTIPTLSCAPSQ